MNIIDLILSGPFYREENKKQKQYGNQAFPYKIRSLPFSIDLHERQIEKEIILFRRNHNTGNGASRDNSLIGT